MERKARHLKCVAAVMLTLSLLLSGQICLAANGRDQLNNVNTGLNIGKLKELSAEWWQWSLSIPASVNPLSFNDEASSAAYCGVGQHGEMWFLGGTLDGSPAMRKCAIPAGTPIFFPIINAECSVVEGYGNTEEALRDCAKELIDHVTEVAASVDGVPLKGLEKSRVQSQLFSFTLPPDDVLGLYGTDPNPSPAVSDGFWVLLPPLPAGQHIIEIHGVAPFPEYGFTFEQNVTYTVDVVTPQS